MFVIEIVSLFVALMINMVEASLSLTTIYKKQSDKNNGQNGTGGESQNNGQHSRTEENSEFYWRLGLIGLKFISIVSVVLGIISLIWLIFAFLIYFQVVYQEAIVSSFFPATIVFGVIQVIYVFIILMLFLVVLIYWLINEIKNLLSARNVIHPTPTIPTIELPGEPVVPRAATENTYETIRIPPATWNENNKFKNPPIRIELQSLPPVPPAAIEPANQATIMQNTPIDDYRCDSEEGTLHIGFDGGRPY